MPKNTTHKKSVVFSKEAIEKFFLTIRIIHVIIQHKYLRIETASFYGNQRRLFYQLATDEIIFFIPITQKLLGKRTEAKSYSSLSMLK